MNYTHVVTIIHLPNDLINVEITTLTRGREMGAGRGVEGISSFWRITTNDSNWIIQMNFVSGDKEQYFNPVKPASKGP